MVEETGVGFRKSKDRGERTGRDAAQGELVRAVLDAAREWLETEDGLFLPMFNTNTRADVCAS